MTDNEIIKALKQILVASFRGGTFCDVIKGAIDLINRLQAENENYSHNVRNMTESIYKYQKTILSQKAEIERLCVEVDELIIAKDLLFDEAEALIKKAKAEAIKEFADLSIKRICEQVLAPTPSESYIVEKCNETIYNLVKEMVGEDNVD